MSEIQASEIELFLEGSNPKKYVVAIEGGYNEPFVNLIINDPVTGKRIERHPFKPFLWYKHEYHNKETFDYDLLYEGKKLKAIEAAAHYGVKTKALKTSDASGFAPDRLANGYRYLATCNKSYNDLIQFFKAGGIEVFGAHSKSFFMFTPVEQFMIQTGIRLFKGMDDYSDLHRFHFDLETEGLFASKHSIFQIGMRDNRGFQIVLETTGNTAQERRDSERINLIKFFQTIDRLQPDVICGYNSESFDWTFIVERCERLGLSLDTIGRGLDGKTKFKRKPSMLKLGNEMEHYMQTYMFGYNVVDIAHSVRRAQAINSDIKNWSLKYVTQYSEVAKENRVYIPGDKIYTIWNDTVNKYAFNDSNGDWYKISERMILMDGYKVTTGSYLIQRYLMDDLWETEQVDNIFNQAAFLISKILPTNFSRSSTMGTATQWKLIMAAWSYERNLAIPLTESKRDFAGGLSRLLALGYARNVVKLDYAALYPKTELTHDIFPNLDISGVMKGLLTYIVDTRDEFKFLTTKHKDIAKDLVARKLDELGDEIKKHKALQNLYDKKQLPLKILANSWFGAYGAPYIFNWGDTDCAEETTCRGRQYLRLMVRHFTEKYGFKALVGDSVTYDTPVYVRYFKNLIDIIPISQLFDEGSEYRINERDFSNKDCEILTRNGWKDIKYVYRHETDKQIHRITTKDRLINVTEDHSLFQDGVEVKPSTLVRGDGIDVYDISIETSVDVDIEKAWLFGFFLGDGSSNNGPRKQYYKSKKTGLTNINKGKRSDWKISNTNLEFLNKLKTILADKFLVQADIKNHLKSSGVYNLTVNDAKFAKLFSDNFYTSYREKRVPIFILNASKEVKKAFINGVFASDGYGNTIEDCSDIGMKSQVAMAGISTLLKSLDIEYKIKTRGDKTNFISFSLKNGNRNNSPFTNKTLKKSNEVWKNEKIENNDTSKYVYDVSTEDGTFICGVGGVIAHNTDGFNFSFPDNIDEVKYTAKGSHWKTTESAGKELIGLDAVLAEFNENYMIGRMGLDIDDICESTINFSRKNYANKIGKKIKFVGNTIKSKKMPLYIEEFLAVAIRLLLDGKGKEFITYYHDYVEKIYNYNIPLVKIASKSKIKTSVSDYKKKANKKNKAGNPMPKQAHMELVLNAGLDVNLGDTIYYVNTGTGKGDGDIKTINKSKMTKKAMAEYIAEHGHEPKWDTQLQINCKLIDIEQVESNMEALKELDRLRKLIEESEDAVLIEETQTKIDEYEKELLTDEYNVAKYLEAFNKRVKRLLVCFNSDIRNKIILNITKDKKTKIEKLDQRNIFTEQQCELVSGVADKAQDQDTYEELMTMEDKEIKFWDKVNKVPNNMTEEEWEVIRADYHVRKAIERAEGIKFEKQTLIDMFKQLEVADLAEINATLILPVRLGLIASLDDNGDFISIKWGVVIGNIEDVFMYHQQAIERSVWYQLNNTTKYEKWLEYISNEETEAALALIVEESMKPRIMEKRLWVLHNEEIPEKEESSDDDDDEEEEEIITDDLEVDIQKAEFEELAEAPTAPLVIKPEINLQEIAKKLEGRVLFPEAVEQAKDYLSQVKSSPKIEDDEWGF